MAVHSAFSHQLDQQSFLAGSAQLSKVAAQLLANMSANEGPALHAVWSACFPRSFTKLAAFHSKISCSIFLLGIEHGCACSNHVSADDCASGLIRQAASANSNCTGDTHGPLSRALLHCCSASEHYAAALCSPTGSHLLRELLSGSVHYPESEPDAEVARIDSHMLRFVVSAKCAAPVPLTILTCHYAASC